MTFFRRNSSIIMVLVPVVAFVFLCISTFSCSIDSNKVTEETLTDDKIADSTDLQYEYDSLKEKYDKQKNAYVLTLKENEKLSDEIEKKDEEVDKLKSEIAALEEKLKNESDGENVEELELQVDRLKVLLDNINPLLKYVYIGSSDPEEINYTFTAFSIEHNKKYYIVTAGHCVADNYGSEGRFKFKANFSDKWLYPELIGYKAEFWNLDDYAVFYSAELNAGLQVSNIETEDNYLPGSIDKGLSVFRNLGDSSKRGESGSPVVNEYGEVIGIYVVYGLVYTPIELALELIENQ